MAAPDDARPGAPDVAHGAGGPHIGDVPRVADGSGDADGPSAARSGLPEPTSGRLTDPPRPAGEAGRAGARLAGSGAPPGVRLYGWRHPSVIAAAVFSAYAGFAQFAATAALPDIAAGFGVAPADAAGGSIAAQVGLSGTTLGIALGIIRLASVASLPLARQADTHGRRRVMLWTSGVALALTAAAAGAPTFWVFVGVLAVARPLLSATNAVSGVIAAEEVATKDRSKAMAVITVGYGVGAGVPVALRALTGGIGGDALSFRTLFALSALLLLTMPLAARIVREPDRAARLVDPTRATATRLGRVPSHLRGRLALLSTLTFFVAFLTGPSNTYLFLYAERVAGLAPSAQGLLAPVAALGGAVGLWVGVHLADRFGRIPTAMWSKFFLAAAGVLTYSAGAWGAAAGYVLTLFIGSSYAPAVASTAAEIFPTSVRATAAGWLTVTGTVGAVLGLVVFGLVADASGSFATAAWVVAVPTAASAVLYRYLPETRGQELEQSAPDLV